MQDITLLSCYFRLMLLEALNQLCATKVGRELLRQTNTYIILRELHKWETDKKCLLACEKVVDILIKYVNGILLLIIYDFF